MAGPRLAVTGSASFSARCPRWTWIVFSALALALALVSGGCSSTTQRDLAVPASNVVNTEGTGTPTTVSGGRGAEVATPTVGAGPSAADRVSLGGSPSDGPDATSAVGEPTKIPARSQGVTDTTISIGVPVLVNYDTVVNAFASKGQTVGDQRAQAQAVIDFLNARGGMDGRQIAPVFQEWDSSNGTFASQAQSTCAGLTQDNEVFAVANHTYGMDTLVECLARANTPLVAGGDTGGWADQAMLDTYDTFLYLPGSLNFTRWGALIDGLVRADFFGEGTRTGLLYLDQPMYRNGSEQAVKPGLSRHGIELVAEQSIQYPESTAGVADTGAATSNAVLRFRAAGVDRVLFVEGIGLIPFLFMPEAESQGYRPRYAIHSSDQASWIVNNAPAAQLQGAVGMGWIVPNDVPLPRDPGGNPTSDLCLGVYDDARVEVLTDRFREHSALAICEHLLFLADALARAPEVSPEGLRAGVEALGTSFRSPLSFATAFGPRRHDGTAAVRPMAYDAQCNCFLYTGEPISLT